jgi:nuclear transport factor 2 (NTF2) superfamily protein
MSGDAGNPNQWMRTHGNEHWEFNEEGLMQKRDMSANDYPIKESERRYLSLLAFIMVVPICW